MIGRPNLIPGADRDIAVVTVLSSDRILRWTMTDNRPDSSIGVASRKYRGAELGRSGR